MTYSTSFTVSFAVAQVELSGETAERNPGISGQGARDMRVARKYEMEDQVLSALRERQWVDSAFVCMKTY